jgi:hypothetical protein
MGKDIIISEHQLDKVLDNILNLVFNRDEDEKKSPSNSKNNVPVDFGESVNKVIDNFEGGYYHTNMYQDGRLNTSVMGDSGETMMGIDRKHGVGFSTSAAGKEFWGLMDNSKAGKNWKYNYMGGPLENKLRGLVTEMIEPEYDRLSDRYLSTESREIVKNSPELTFNFIYATWNGPSWFQKFARAINDAVEDGITNSDDLIKIAIKSRRESGNSLIAKSGNIMSKLFNV